MSDLFRPEAIQARQNRWAGDAGRVASPLVLARIALYDWSEASACVPEGCVLPGV